MRFKVNRGSEIHERTGLIARPRVNQVKGKRSAFDWLCQIASAEEFVREISQFPNLV
jgi:hypothetical protein